MPWRFDADTRQLRPETGEPAAVRVCEHLAPTLAYLIAQGSTVTVVLTQAWSAIDLDVSLDRAPACEAIPSALYADGGVETWSNQDPHYPLAQGLRCTACRQALGWPIQ